MIYSNKYFNVMPVNLDRLDRLQEHDLTITALDGFIAELTIEFIASIEGDIYIEAYPSATEYIGSWIDRLLYFGYVCESVTLPNMTTDNVEVIVTQVFPQQILNLDPLEVNTAIPELLAFWQFLQQKYKHPQAPEIIEFLRQLIPQFEDVARDLQNLDLVSLPISEIELLDLIAEEDIQEFSSGDRNSSRKCVFNNPISEGTLLSHTQVELASSLQELATELLSEFPQEVPSAQELHLLLQHCDYPQYKS